MSRALWRADDAVAPAALGLVEGGVGALDELGGALQTTRSFHRRDAPARGEAELAPGGRQPLRRDARAQALGGDERAVGVGPRQNGQELLATDAPGQIARPERRAQEIAERDQHLVAARVAVRVVDLLEVIDVERHDREP